MINFLYKHRFLFIRRLVQLTIFTLYFSANTYGWSIVKGNFSSSLIFGFIPLSDPFALLQMFLAGAVIATDILLGAIIVLIIYGILFGRFFCSWVCPVNVITETASSLRRFFKLNTNDDSSYLSRNIRYFIIFLALLFSYIFSISAFEMISPIGIAHRGIIFSFGFGWIILLAIFLFDLFTHKYGWCGHLCPLGGFNAIIGKYSLIKVVHDKDKCTNSFECFNVCPEKEILYMVGKISMPINGAPCIKCARCIEVCDSNAFEFSIVSMAKQLKDK